MGTSKRWAFENEHACMHSCLVVAKIGHDAIAKASRVAALRPRLRRRVVFAFGPWGA